MKKNHTFTFATILTMLVFAACESKKGGTTADKRPNIVFIFSDDHAYQSISAYGSKLANTPNIDRIAQEGALFRNTFITNSICGPSRAILLTGKYSHINGYTVNERKFDATQDVFPELLQQSGYQTAWVGKLHLGAVPKGLDYWNLLPGQGHYFNPDFINTQYDTTRHKGYVTDLITDFSVDWLNKRDTTKPFFLVVGQKATHREWQPALEDLGAYDSVTFPIPETFYDDYKGREAAAKQDMTIEKTMRLREDLKVDVDWGGFTADFEDRKKELIKQRFGNNTPTPEQEKQVENYLRNGMFTRMDDEQKKVAAAYYAGISKEFKDKKLSGKALTEWKYQRYLKDYLATANSLDRNIGRILQYLDDHNLSENTIVIYASDQGFYMGEHGWFDKRFIYEQSLRTAFVFRYPGVVKPGTVVDDFAIGQDWSATLLDAAGITVPADIQGTSLLPVLKGEKVDWRKSIYYHYYEFPEPHHVYPHFGIRNSRYKLVKFYGGVESWELYDLKTDPGEVNNIYEAKKDDQLVTDLKADLKALINQYQDTAALRISGL